MDLCVGLRIDQHGLSGMTLSESSSVTEARSAAETVPNDGIQGPVVATLIHPPATSFPRWDRS